MSLWKESMDSGFPDGSVIDINPFANKKMVIRIPDNFAKLDPNDQKIANFIIDSMYHVNEKLDDYPQHLIVNHAVDMIKIVMLGYLEPIEIEDQIRIKKEYSRILRMYIDIFASFEDACGPMHGGFTAEIQTHKNYMEKSSKELPPIKVEESKVKENMLSDTEQNPPPPPSPSSPSSSTDSSSSYTFGFLGSMFSGTKRPKKRLRCV